MRNTKRGSWFIQELNKALRLLSRDTHLADILVQVNTCLMFLYSAVTVYFGNFFTEVLLCCFLYFRSTLVSKRGRVLPQARHTTVVKRCQSSPAHCAKTSTFSPSTSPSIDKEIMQPQMNTRRSFLHRLLPHHHSHIPTVASKQDLFPQTSDVNACVHSQKSWKGKRSKLMLIYMYSEMGSVLAYNVLVYQCVCDYAS